MVNLTFTPKKKKNLTLIVQCKSMNIKYHFHFNWITIQQLNIYIYISILFFFSLFSNLVIYILCAPTSIQLQYYISNSIKYYLFIHYHHLLPSFLLCWFHSQLAHFHIYKERTPSWRLVLNYENNENNFSNIFSVFFFMGLK